MSNIKQAGENSAGRAQRWTGFWIPMNHRVLIEEAGLCERRPITGPNLVLHSLDISVSMWTVRWWVSGQGAHLACLPLSHTVLSRPQALNMCSVEMMEFTKATCFSTAHH